MTDRAPGDTRRESLRIAFATPEYVTESGFDGGLANYLARVAGALADLGHDVHVVTLSDLDTPEFPREGVTVHRVRSGRLCAGLSRLARSPLPSALLFLDFSVQVYRKLKWLDARQPLCLVQFPSYSFCGLVSTCFLDVPHVLRASSYQPVLSRAAGMKRDLNLWLVERLESLQFRLSRFVYAPSHSLQRVLTRESRLPGVRVIRPPFFVETKDWDPSVHERRLKGRRYLLFFGRFQMHKGFHTLAQALPRFLEECPDACAALVGRDASTRLAASMAAHARELCGRFGERLVILDQLPHRQLYPVIEGAHLVVLPSLVENLPNAGLEAMGLGKAVVGTTGTSFEELIREEETGFLVPPDDPEQLAVKIISVWSHPKLEQIGAAARVRTLEFAPANTMDALLTYYRDCMGDRTPHIVGGP